MSNYFTSAFVSFFKELSKNNTTAWFNENKKTYERDVKIPFTNFIQHVIEAAAKLDPDIQIEAKEAITRINRDIRFSKDKSPYKLHMSAIISSKGKKDKESPGIYIELSPEHIMIYGGAYMLEKEPLLNVRKYISAHLKEFDKIISEKTFVTLFGSIRGEKNKVLAPEFKMFIGQAAIALE